MTKKSKEQAPPGVLDILEKYSITLRQKTFCDLYMQDEHLMGNGAACYAKAYGLKATSPTCKANATRALSNAYIRIYCNSLLTLTGFDDASMDKVLNELAAHDDPAIRRDAIKEYNRLKRRVSDKLLDLDGRDADISINIVKKYNGPQDALVPGSDAAAPSVPGNDAAPETAKKEDGAKID